MTSTTRDLAPPAHRPLGFAPLAVRISGGGLDGRIVRLQSPKCTVGSGPRCTLRLLGRGIRPLHCLIVRADRGTFVRRWSPDTRLNGVLFEDAALRGGDRLTIGPLDLEVLAEEEERAADRDSASPNEPSEDPAVEALRNQLAAQRNRARGLLAGLRASRRQREDLEVKVGASLAAQQQAEERVGQVTSEAGAAADQVRALEARVEAFEQEKARLTEQNDTAQQELQQLRDSQASQADLEQCNRPGSNADELQVRISELSAELDAHKERERALITQLKLANDRQAELRQRIGEFSSDDAERSSAMEARLAELEREKRELADLRREFQEERDRLAADRAAWETERSHEPESDEAAAHPVPSRASDNQAEAAIERLRELSLWNDISPEDDPEAPPDDAPLPSGAPVSFLEKYAPQLFQGEPADDPSFSPSGADLPPKMDDEESLSDYMSKLMDRVRGDEAPPVAPRRRPEPERTRPPSRASKPAERARNAREVPSPTPVAPAETAPETAAPAPFRLQDIKRSKSLPERSGNFAAMRELANQSAHSAIANYRAQRVARVGLMTLLSGGICLGTGLAALYLAAELRSAATIGGAAGLLLALYFFLRGTLNLFSILREGRYVVKKRRSVKRRPKAEPAKRDSEDANVAPTPTEQEPENEVSS